MAKHYRDNRKIAKAASSTPAILEGVTCSRKNTSPKTTVTKT